MHQAFGLQTSDKWAIDNTVFGFIDVRDQILCLYKEKVQKLIWSGFTPLCTTVLRSMVIMVGKQLLSHLFCVIFLFTCIRHTPKGIRQSLLHSTN